MSDARAERFTELVKAGWELSLDDINRYEPHFATETEQHQAVKLYLTAAIRDLGHGFATEVEHPERGIVDVLSFNESGTGAWVYEVETGFNRDDEIAKVNQYTDGVTATEINEVKLVDPTDAPGTIEACAAWCAEQVER